MKNHYETWKRIANRQAKIDPDIEPALVAQLMTNQENYIKKNKTILDVARENFKKKRKKGKKEKRRNENSICSILQTNRQS